MPVRRRFETRDGAFESRISRASARDSRGRRGGSFVEGYDMSGGWSVDVCGIGVTTN